MPYEKMTVMVCSTGHVTEAEANDFEKGICPGDDLPSPMIWEYGWIIFVGTTGDWIPDSKILSPGLCSIIDYARSESIEWVRFDCYAETIPGIPHYDW